jgi:hypothetical protein
MRWRSISRFRDGLSVNEPNGSLSFGNESKTPALTREHRPNNQNVFVGLTFALLEDQWSNERVRLYTAPQSDRQSSLRPLSIGLSYYQ